MHLLEIHLSFFRIFVSGRGAAQRLEKKWDMLAQSSIKKRLKLVYTMYTEFLKLSSSSLNDMVVTCIYIIE